MFCFVSLVSVALASVVLAQTYSQTFTPDNAPNTWQPGQTGTNKCASAPSQDSMCQNLYINSVEDFCLFAPHQPGPASDIGNRERDVVAWCIKPGYGTRLMPPGTITGAHFIQTPDYVQVTGTGDLTKLNIPKGDNGGELDPHGEDGLGNPIGGLVFSSAFGDGMKQMHEWTNFMSESEFCVRACKDGPNAVNFCQHIYDLMGCQWNMPGNYAAGFDGCKAESGEPMGINNGVVFHQGEPVTPAPHPPPATSQCAAVSTIGAPAPSSSSTSSSSSSLPPPLSSLAPLPSKAPAAPSSINRTRPTSPPGRPNSPPGRPTPTSSRPAAQVAGNSATAQRGPFVWVLPVAFAGAAVLAIMRM